MSASPFLKLRGAVTMLNRYRQLFETEPLRQDLRQRIEANKDFKRTFSR